MPYNKCTYLIISRVSIYIPESLLCSNRLCERRRDNDFVQYNNQSTRVVCQQTASGIVRGERTASAGNNVCSFSPHARRPNNLRCLLAGMLEKRTIYYRA